MLLHAELLARVRRLDEPIALDHFETFAFSQWDRVAVATPVGCRSLFLYGLEPAPHRRSGRVTAHQRRSRARREVPPPETGHYLRSTRRALDQLAARAPAAARIDLCTDGMEVYKAALARHPARHRFAHHAHPTPQRGPRGAPRSPAARARDQALWGVDVTHGFWRHSSANHKRETIAFARRANAILERGYLFAVWRNLVKVRSERHPQRGTPAMWLGLADRPWGLAELLGRRLFPGRTPMLPGLMKLYRRDWVTPALGRNARHQLKNAF